MEESSWGIELWDQVENLLKHEADQTTTTDAYFKLLTDVQKLQHEFGKKLRKTVALHLPKSKPGPDDVTYSAAFYNLVQQFMEMALIHERMAKNMNDQVVTQFKLAYDNEKRAFEEHRSFWSKLNGSIEQTRKLLESVWQKYVTAFKEKQKAHDNYTRAQADIQLARIDIEKFETTYQSKVQSFDQAARNYASELDQYNKSNSKQFNESIICLIEKMESADRLRDDRTRSLLETLSKLNEDINQSLANCNEQVKDAVNSINSSHDSALIIKRLRTGDLRPVNLPFLNLEICPSELFDSSPAELGALLLGLNARTQNGQLTTVSATSSTYGGGGGSGSLGVGSMFSGLKRTNVKGLREEYNNLRTPFVCGIGLKSVKLSDLTIRQISDRLQEITHLTKKTESELLAVQRMVHVCKTDQKMGNIKEVEPELGVCQRRLHSLNKLVKQLEDKYNELGGDSALMAARELAAKLNPQISTDSNANRTTGLIVSGGLGGGVRVQSNEFDSDDSFESDGEADVTSTGLLKPSNSTYVGYAICQYDYEGNGSAYLAAKTGERFFVVNLDTENSGWTSVISEDGTRQGFVPTSYIDITLY